MVKSVFEWNSHSILFEGLMVDSVLIGIDVESHLWHWKLYLFLNRIDFESHLRV